MLICREAKFELRLARKRSLRWGIAGFITGSAVVLGIAALTPTLPYLRGMLVAALAGLVAGLLAHLLGLGRAAHIEKRLREAQKGKLEAFGKPVAGRLELVPMERPPWEGFR